MRDLKDPNWIKLKASLFLFLGLLFSILLWLEKPTIRFALFLVLAIWCFCRFYYFAFYVLERYIDPSYRFSGLLSLVRYFLARKRQKF